MPKHIAIVCNNAIFKVKVYDTTIHSTVCMNDDQLPTLSNPFLSLLETSGRPCRRYRRRSGWRKKLLVTRPTDVAFENAYCRRLYIDVGSMCICISSSAHGTAFFYATFATRGRTAWMIGPHVGTLLAQRSCVWFWLAVLTVMSISTMAVSTGRVEIQLNTTRCSNSHKPNNDIMQANAFVITITT